MKINVEQLPAQLRAHLQSGFWLASDEIFLQQLAADLIRCQAKQAGFIDRLVFHIDAQFNWDNVYQQLDNRSLFSDKPLLELHFVQDKFTESDRKALQQCIRRLNEELCLLVLSYKIETQTQKAKWFEEVTKTLCFVPIWPLTATQYTTWIKNRSQHYQLQLEVDALRWLATQTQGNVLAADQALQQLQLLYPHQSINQTMIAELLHDAMQTDLFTFVDVFLSSPHQALLHLQLLKNQQVEPILIIWALARELRILNNLLLQVAQGQSLQTAFKTYYIWPSRQALMTQACKQFSQQRIAALISQLAMIDLYIKGIERGCPWLALERLLLC